MTAHLLLGKQHLKVTWRGPHKNPESLDWVKDCRSGSLVYPPRVKRLSEVNRVTKVFQWTKHLEIWHWTVADVTHVNANIEDYFGDQGSNSNDFIYSLKHGKILSKSYTPSEIREMMASNVIAGDRVGAVAVKAENCKYPGKQRETVSGDDIMRELLSELDINIANILHATSGVAMRTGRNRIEVAMENITASSTDNSVIISLDIEGWNPNPPRVKEMQFAQLLIDFYDAPKGFRVENIFKDISIIADKQGYRDIWQAVDGSIQGFFGGC